MVISLSRSKLNDREKRPLPLFLLLLLQLHPQLVPLLSHYAQRRPQVLLDLFDRQFLPPELKLGELAVEARAAYFKAVSIEIGLSLSGEPEEGVEVQNHFLLLVVERECHIGPRAWDISEIGRTSLEG